MVALRHLSAYHEAYKLALEIYRVWDDIDERALLQQFDNFGGLIKPLVDEVDPGWGNCASLGRHMAFMKRNLERGNKEYSSSDAADIVYHDLPTFADYLFSRASAPSHLDPRLNEATSKLFEIEDYASVIRATFPVLSSRMRRVFGIEEGSDGENLVNDVFRRGVGTNPVSLPEEEKLAYRNLVAGFYAAYRNKLNHGDYQPTLAQARGIVEMANTLIQDLEIIAVASLEAGEADSL